MFPRLPEETSGRTAWPFWFSPHSLAVQRAAEVKLPLRLGKCIADLMKPSKVPEVLMSSSSSNNMISLLGPQESPGYSSDVSPALETKIHTAALCIRDESDIMAASLFLSAFSVLSPESALWWTASEAAAYCNIAYVMGWWRAMPCLLNSIITLKAMPHP